MNNFSDIFVSTGAFQTRDVNAVLDLCLHYELFYLELSSFCDAISQEDIRRIEMLSKQKMAFLLHNYFPPPKKPFVLNLSSNNPEINALSMAHCKNAIDISHALGAPFFSVHSGFCINPTPESLGRPLTEYPRIDFSEARGILINNLRLLSDDAAEKGLEIALENHVLSPFNLIEGKNHLLIGVTAEDLLGILDEVDRENLGLLIDTGHLKVSAKTLNIDPSAELYHLRDRIIAFHLSDNNGLEDSNGKVTNDSWFWPVISECARENPVPLIIEVNQLSMTDIKEQLEIARRNITEKMTGSST